jgi:probable rRNA maturation factor
MNKVTVISLDERFKKNEENVKKAVLGILKILNKNGISVEIYLINGQKIRFLNKKFRGKNKTTTVLSFEEPRNFIYPPLTRKRGIKPASKFKKIGEIYIKLPITNYPIIQLLTHGLLHLFGYSHQRKNDRIRMERKEHQLLKILNSNI